ncbi:S-adenosyl-L-methionine-dependent methyltransferase [Bimuria novae-zelandiae CBS 107.79]|uniref:S-adenosyl-L-methionine-dependent methyltransferase n=1 Tax=Bimuria novae-zelandiae CBS 107.79 TaxID=1447943 RepID=A0A6A5VYL8_9PLEO|nr:S-adenosyl-L-methionine-dependent methyltransferase [Bimuria novae-zelandiae CBS 107.79]
MSLYYEAADVLANSEKTGGSLKSRIYKNKDRKNSPAQLFALISEASKWSPVLKDVIERCGLLAEEKKLTPTLALLLTHDLLLTKGVAAKANHVLKLAILRHKARLSAEFTKARIRRRYATLEALKEAVDSGQLDGGDEPLKKAHGHPRWVRVNTLQTSVAEQLSTTFAGYSKASNIGEIQGAPASVKIYLEDPHIPNLLALPPKIDLSKSSAYVNGDIIFQDKASCFPAYMLDVGPLDGDAIDGCAAPGNKTTHLAAILSERNAGSRQQKVFAYEKDKIRAITLKNMVKRASADSMVTVKAGADFLRANGSAEEFANVGAILLDPSCSGSGIVGRDEAINMHLPALPAGVSTPATGKKEKKRKRGQGVEKTEADHNSTLLNLDFDDSTPEETPIEDQLSERLIALSTFQLSILTHAMRFPKARKITYSTCSIHFEENEGVVFQALASAAAKEQGWRILRREQQVKGLRDWTKRGIWQPGKLDAEVNMTEEMREDICDACIRCEKGTEEGTMGFFVAAFVRDIETGRHDTTPNNDVVRELEEEWSGFSDDEPIMVEDGGEAKKATVAQPAVSDTSKRPKKKRKKRRTQ